MMNNDMSYEHQHPWFFDVDGVLCDTGTCITPEFQEYFLKWMHGRCVFLVTGSTHEKTRWQVGDAIVDAAMMTFNCMGNSVWMNNREILRMNPIHLNKYEYMWLHHEIILMPFPEKLGNHVEHRGVTLNVSFTGRPTPPELRAAFKAWDAKHEYRERLISRFNEQNPRLEAYIGGETSIDICLRHANKAQVIGLLPHGLTRTNFTFFADKCFPGGIDYPLARLAMSTNGILHEVQGYQDTWDILRRMYP